MIKRRTMNSRHGVTLTEVLSFDEKSNKTSITYEVSVGNGPAKTTGNLARAQQDFDDLVALAIKQSTYDDDGYGI